MARVVRGPLKINDTYTFPPIPQPNSKIATEYKRLLPERSRHFSPPNKRELIDIPETRLQYSQHQLRHEAESIFWNLLHWVMTAQPADKKKTNSTAMAEGFRPTLLPADWDNLISYGDNRNKAFIASDFETRLVHPTYSPLYTLLDDMRKHLRGDLELSTDELRKQPEYLHEVFQRLIINFLAENNREPFMDLKRSKTTRRVDPAGMKSTSSGAVTSSKGMVSTRGSQLTSTSVTSDSPQFTGQKRGFVSNVEDTSETGPVSQSQFYYLLAVAYISTR